MEKSVRQIARSLRAFRNAQKLGLLRGVRIAPGPNACEVARAQAGTEHAGHVVPRVPLAGCTRIRCECKYVPIGSDKLRRLNVDGMPPPELF